MREKLNDNPIAQVALIGVLLLAVGLFLMRSMGGGEEAGESSAGDVSAEVQESVGTLEPGVATSASASVSPALTITTDPPAAVTAAYDSGKTVALLFVHDGGIDDELVRDASAALAGLSEVAVFVVPAADIYRYASITEGVGVERVPALVVIRPKRADGDIPSASVSYGFQSGASVVQAVIDAGYEGPTVDYHP